MSQNTKGEKSKENLIECAARLFMEKGYNATGINDILNNAGLSKGSFYFYFESKKDLAMGVADYYGKIKMNEILKAADGRAWEEFAEKVVRDIIERAGQNKSFGCPFAVLGAEIAFLEPDIADKYYASIKSIAGIFYDVLKKSGMPEGKAAVAADRAFAMYEGYLLFYRISKDIGELEKLLRDLKAVDKYI